MQSIVQLNIWQFSLIYLLLVIVLAVMKKAKVNQTKLLIWASIRMTVQLVLAGFILTYIFKNPHPVFTIGYIVLMAAFSIHLTLSKNKHLSKKFKIAVAVSIAIPGVLILIYFLAVVIRTSLFNPQYVIPISGMIFGNTITGVSLALKTFDNGLKHQKLKTETLLNLGVEPEKILRPHVNHALETALLPTMNSMLGMGIVSLPGMMTGQILAGTLPLTAILYQIAIMISICTATCLSVFCSLQFGYKTLYNKQKQIVYF